MQGLSEVLRKHKSRMQLEKEASVAGQAGGRENVVPSYMRPTAAFRHATSNNTSLGDTLVVHQSRLEKEKAAAAKQAESLQSTPQSVSLICQIAHSSVNGA